MALHNDHADQVAAMKAEKLEFRRISFQIQINSALSLGISKWDCLTVCVCVCENFWNYYDPDSMLNENYVCLFFCKKLPNLLCIQQ